MAFIGLNWVWIGFALGLFLGGCKSNFLRKSLLEQNLRSFEFFRKLGLYLIKIVSRRAGTSLRSVEDRRQREEDGSISKIKMQNAKLWNASRDVLIGWHRAQMTDDRGRARFLSSVVIMSYSICY